LENLKPNYRTEGLLREMVSITCPTLLVWGRDDPVFPVECTERFNHIMPTIKKTIIFDHARHLPFFEYPEPFNTAVADFFSK
jgi:pimeloyl-ACP methyl ester carboxylesterase